MLTLDHLAVVAPTLTEGVAHARASLGLDIPEGGRHREMGTRNHLLRLGPALFLEVIAVDPEAPHPGRPRWFGLDDGARVRADWEAGRRLRAFVARTDDLDGLLARHPGLFGQAERMSRGDLAWRFAVRADGGLPEDGLLPCPMEWGPGGSPARAMPDRGARLLAVRVEHPNPQDAAARYAALGLRDAPEIRPGPVLRFTAEIDTPAGPRTLS
ncbi:VOC family protein [Methylobacterium sp. A54F]